MDKPITSESLILESCEPSPDSCLNQHAQIRILFISNIYIPVAASAGATVRTVGNHIQQHQLNNNNAASRGLGVEVCADTEGGPLRGRVLALMRERSSVRHEDVKTSFPAASEFYSPNARLNITTEETNNDSTSLWENMCMYKRIGAVVTVVNGACATAKQQVAAVKAIFQQKAFASVVGRCFVFEGSDELMASLDRNVFKRVSIAEKPLKAHVESIMLSLTGEIVHYFTHRVNNLQNSTSHGQVTTPMDKGSAKQVEGKVLAARAAKQQGDVLLQLGATSAALQAYSKAVGTCPIWTAATLEAFAAARYLDNNRFFANAAPINTQLLALCAGDRQPKNMDLALLEEVMNLVGTRLEMAVRTGPLPPTTKQRLVSEVESILMKKILEIKPKIALLKELMSSGAGDVNEEGDPTDDLRNALAEVHTLYGAIVRLSYAELELYLSEAYFMLPKSRSGKGLGDSTRLIGLEVELLLKLAKLRAEQRNAKGLLECIGSLHGVLPLLGCCSSKRELLISRRLPDLCFECGCVRKAVYYLQQSAASDRDDGRIQESLQSLLKACQWCSIPIAFDAKHGGLRLERDFTISSANATSQRSPFIFADGTAAANATINNTPSSVRIQVSLLLELLATLRSVQDLDESQWGLACHVAALLIFKFYDYIDDLGQSKLNFVLQTCSVTLPMHLRPTIVSPPLIRAINPLPLAPHLCPQNQHVSGVKFIRFNTKTALFCFAGEIMKSSLVWVAGECAQVQIQIVNPFRNEIQLSSVAVRGRSKSGAPNAMTSYVTHGALVKPHGTDTIIVNVLPLVPGILLIEGVEVRIGQSGFKNPIAIQMPPIEVPIMSPMPFLTCSFNLDEVELFAKQQHTLTATIHNVGSLRIDTMTFTLHRDDCNLQGCEGCIEKPSPQSITGLVDRGPLKTALPLAAGSSVALKAVLTPPQLIKALKEEYIIARIDYSQRFDDPLPPKNAADGTTPTYAPIPRRTHDARLRVFLLPGIEVTDISISADRRYIIAQVQGLSDVAAMVLLPNDKVPFERQANVTILPRQEAALRFVIARIPLEHRKFTLQWQVQDRPDVCGILPLDFTEHLEHVRCTEPLEDVVVSGTLLDDNHHRNNAHVRIGGKVAPPPALVLPWGTAAPAATSAVPSWMSLQQNPNQPYLVSAVQPVRFRLTVTVPWQTVVPLNIAVHFDEHDDGAVIAGPTSTRWMLGAGCEAYDEEMEMYLFTTGEHSLRITVRDEGGREIRYAWVFIAEHENTTNVVSTPPANNALPMPPLTAPLLEGPFTANASKHSSPQMPPPALSAAAPAAPPSPVMACADASHTHSPMTMGVSV